MLSFMPVMIKYFTLVLIANLFLVISNLSTGDVHLQINAPALAEAGSTVEVDIELRKSGLTGFARFQQELPYGVTASPVYPTDMNFSFEDNTVKMIWLSLPQQEVINIRYRIHINERLKGNLLLNGTFSYIDNNQRRSADATGTHLAINQSSGIDDRLVVDVSESNQRLLSPAPSADPTGEVMAFRQQPLADNDLGYVVNILVNKGDKNYFAKIEENIPEGFVAIEKDSKEGIFSFSDQKARIIWRNLPMEDNFIVSYRLIPQNEEGMTPEVTGEFSFMHNDITASRQIVEREEDLKEIDGAGLQRLIASVPTRAISPTVPSAAATAVPADRPRRREVAQAITDDPSRPVARPGVRITNPLLSEPGIYYRVQLAAGRREIDPVRYFGRLKIENEVRSEIHEGWIKYSVGSFEDYRSARDYRVEIWNNTPVADAFVAAYNDGTRITVQEALIIANQRWYK